MNQYGTSVNRGIMCNIPVCRGKNWLSHDINLLNFEVNLRILLWDFLCNYIYPQTAVTFLAGSCVAKLGMQIVDLLIVLICLIVELFDLTMFYLNMHLNNFLKSVKKIHFGRLIVDLICLMLAVNSK